MENLFRVVQNQFPEFIRSLPISHPDAAYPMLIEFVRAYYKWYETEYIPGQLNELLTIDTAPEQFVEYFRKQLDVYGILNSVPNYDPKYLRHIQELYSAKGSERALVYLIKLITGADATVTYPKDNVLRASTGQWYQERFLTVQPTIVTDEIIASIESAAAIRLISSTSVVPVQILRQERINTQEYRVYFRTTTNVPVTAGMLVWYEGADGQPLTYVDGLGVTRNITASVVMSPNSLQVVDAGAGWQHGQIIIIPGDGLDTIARVTEATSTGAIISTEILQYGYGHTASSTITLSPYPYKPLAGTFTYEYTQLSATAKHHTIGMIDYVEGVTDYVAGNAYGSGGDVYFSENYAAVDYAGGTSFSTITGYTPPTTVVDQSGLTTEEWLESLTTLQMVMAPSTSMKGSWMSEQGKVSSPDIRIQDSFYYQQFSYVVDSVANPESYTIPIATVHPAGTIQFQRYRVEREITLPALAQVSFPYTTAYKTDILAITDQLAQRFTKARVDAATATDTMSRRTHKYKTDDVFITSTDTVNVQTTTFGAEDYFAETYTQRVFELSIGA